MFRLLIITENTDTAVNKICNWLNCTGVKYTRFNAENLINSFRTLTIGCDREDQIIINYDGVSHNLLDYDLIFFRRGFFIEFNYFNGSDFVNNEVANAANSYYNNEVKSILNFIYYRVKHISINIPTAYNIDKLTGIFEARKIGFKVSSTQVFQRSIKLDINRKYIVKPNSLGIRSYIQRNLFLKSEHSFIANMDSLNSQYTLIQEYEEKEFELRVFFFLNEMKAFALLSQLDKRTKKNSRTGVNGLRYIPFKLDRLDENKIRKLMEALDLNSGSIDFIVSSKGELIFLEVNPVGMFDYVGFNSGISLEKFVVNQILKYGEKIKKNHQ